MPEREEGGVKGVEVEGGPAQVPLRWGPDRALCMVASLECTGGSRRSARCVSWSDDAPSTGHTPYDAPMLHTRGIGTDAVGQAHIYCVSIGHRPMEYGTEARVGRGPQPLRRWRLRCTSTIFCRVL
jgi:hypothetical protein